MIGQLIGYARASSLGQDVDIQVEQLKAAGCHKLFTEKRSGRTLAGREALTEALGWAREGDTLIVTRLDRLARSGADLYNIVEQLNAKGVGFKCLQQGMVDTTTPSGKLVLGILGAVAEFENDIRRERQREGIDKAKARGVYKGRPAAIDAAEVKRLKAAGHGAAAIARQLGIGRASVYRVLNAPARV